MKRHFEKIPGAVSLAVLVIPILLLMSAYYLWVWDAVESFVAAVDHSPELFRDFQWSYYPMGQTLLRTFTPVPGYFYSAFFALLLVPFGALETAQAMWGWGALQALSLVALCVIPVIRLHRMSHVSTAFYTGLYVMSFPLLHNTNWGQVSVLLTACIVAAFHFHAGKKPVQAGMILAVAASIKYYPAVFLVYFILKREWRVCMSFILTVVFLYVMIPAIFMGPDKWLLFEIARKSAMSGVDWISINSQYFVHVLKRWIHLVFRISVGPVGTNILTLAGFAIFLSNMVLIRLIQRKKFRDENSLSLVLIFLSLPFIIKTSWPHYLCYLPFCQMVIFTHMTPVWHLSNPWKKAVLLLPLASVACSSVFMFKAFPGWMMYNAIGLLFISNLILLVCVYGIILKNRAFTSVDQ